MPHRRHHTAAWHRCFDKLGGDSSAAAICTSSTERTGNVYEDGEQPTGSETKQHKAAGGPGSGPQGGGGSHEASNMAAIGEKQIELAQQLLNQGHPVAVIAKKLGVSVEHAKTLIMSVKEHPLQHDLPPVVGYRMNQARQVHLLGATGVMRTATHEGREHLVVPVVALMEGVIHAINAETPEFVPMASLMNAPQGWNGRPIMLGHPVANGRQISANSPTVLESQSFGRVFQSRLDGKKLCLEAWIDPIKAEAIGASDVLTKLRAGEMCEVSVGAFVVTENKAGEFNGKPYKAIWRDIIPDHVAFLPKGIGACSIAMGCGSPRMAMRVEDSELRVLEESEIEALGGPGSGPVSHAPGSPTHDLAVKGAQNRVSKNPEIAQHQQSKTVVKAVHDVGKSTHVQYGDGQHAEFAKGSKDLTPSNSNPGFKGYPLEGQKGGIDGPGGPPRAGEPTPGSKEEKAVWKADDKRNSLDALIKGKTRFTGGPGSGPQGSSVAHKAAADAHKAAAKAHGKIGPDEEEPLLSIKVSAAEAATKAASDATAATGDEKAIEMAKEATHLTEIGMHSNDEIGGARETHKEAMIYHNREAARLKLKGLGGPGSGPQGGATVNRPVEEKDTRRIASLLDKSKGSLAKASQHAANMAKAIKDPGKARRRGNAAANVGEHSIAQIFYDRHQELVGRAAGGPGSGPSPTRLHYKAPTDAGGGTSGTPYTKIASAAFSASEAATQSTYKADNTRSKSAHVVAEDAHNRAADMHTKALSLAPDTFGKQLHTNAIAEHKTAAAGQQIAAHSARFAMDDITDLGGPGSGPQGGSKIAKSILGAGAKDDGNGKFSWLKRGGYAYAKKAAVHDKLLKAGFIKSENTSSANADGSHMGGGTNYSHPDGHTASISSSYGNTKDDNWHSINLNLNTSKLKGAEMALEDEITDLGGPVGGTDMAFKVGDKVAVNKPGAAAHGKTGTIASSFKGGTVHKVGDLGSFHQSELKAAEAGDNGDSNEAAELIGYHTMRTLCDQVEQSYNAMSDIVDDLISAETDDPTDTTDDEASEEIVETAQLESVKTLGMAIYSSVNALMSLANDLLTDDDDDAAGPRYMAGKIVDCKACDGSGEKDGNPCEMCDGKGELKVAAGARHSESDRKIIQGVHDNAVALGADCPPSPITAEQKPELRAAADVTNTEGDAMTKEQKTELVKELVADKHSGFTAADEKMLEVASDERLEAFKVAAVARAAEVKALAEKPAAEIKQLSEEDFMKMAPESIKTLVTRQQTADTAHKASLVAALKTAQSEYTESELSALSIDTLARLGRVAKIDVETPATYEGRGVPIQRSATAVHEDSFLNPPDPYKDGLERLRTAEKFVN